MYLFMFCLFSPCFSLFFNFIFYSLLLLTFWVFVCFFQQTQAEKWGDGSYRGRKVLQWTDEAVDQLLDRSAVSEEGATAGGGDGVKGGAAAVGENALGSLLQTFKVTRR